MADLGKVAVTDGGNYSASTTYEKLTFVHYQGDAYMTLKTVKGVTPTDDGVNYKLFCKSAVLATASKAGIVMPDGTTTTVNSSGKMSAKQATQSTTGIVKGSNSIKVGSDGAIDVNTTFTQAVNLANIITGEAIATILGKVSKAIATTMNLNQNALLKSMLTSIDANDSSKIPTSAYIHTLVERIGMGTQLTAGANLTEAANNLSSNLKVGTTTVLASGQAGAIRTSNIIFDTSFSKMPSISVAIYNEYPSVFQATISKVTKLGFSLYLETIKETSEQSVLVHWIASAK
ncbi:putative uncharacterized protein [[Clostridium] clostridioforme CAG:511]|jgi:hypothetical protein|nr:putative uncharacterized protein [[Clostridium] clostridioforme CAG:511]